MSRYEDAQIITNDVKIEQGKKLVRRRLSTHLMPTIENADTDIYVMTRMGDRLDLLAHEYYGDFSLWWVIAQANGLGKGTWAVEPSLTIVIPQLVDGVNVNELIKDYNDRR